MTFYEALPSFEILDLNIDSDGRYLKIRAELEDGCITIRWGLDKYTFGKLKKAISIRHFDNMPGLHYIYRLSRDCTILQRNNEMIHVGTVECIFGDKRKNIEFSCSVQFASNLNWLRTEVKSVKDLKHLDWDNWREALNHT